jgi:hypothetical protein
MSDLFQEVKGLTKDEALRITAMELANELHNFRSDVPRDEAEVVETAKRIFTYLTTGT